MTIKNLVGPVALMLVLGLGLPSPSAFADQGRGRGKGRGEGRGEGKSEEKAEKKAERGQEKTENRGGEKARANDVVVIDRDGHRRIVREYYASNALPPGLAKREALPPGLQKQLRERGALPPGLQQRLTPVPPALGGRLPGVPAYYSRYFAGRDLIVVDTRTNRIVSIIAGVLP